MRSRPHLQPRPRTALLGLFLSLSFLATAFLQAPGASAATPGEVHVIRNATSSFDRFTSGATTTQQQWMRDSYRRMRGYAPYFDRALAWAPPADFYRDLYAIYPDETTLLKQHPDWVLKDGSGNKLYIPWACNGTSCTQYAADIGNPGFRQHWIDEAKADIAKGYRGIFIDDVNLEMKVGDGSGDFTRPVDPRTGQGMTDSSWRKYMAEFVEAIRAQIPTAHITHNTAWWMEHSDPYVQREVRAADSIELERGFSDPGLVGGTGKYGFRTLLSHVDWLHSLDAQVILEPNLSTPAQRQFELASYYLISNGSDFLCTSYQTDPDNWWTGWDTNLGAAQGDRYEWNGLLRRDFQGGFVLVNPPGATTRSVSLGGAFTEVGADTVTSVKLEARRGAVLLGGGTIPPSPAPEEPAPEAPTPTPPNESAPTPAQGDPVSPAPTPTAPAPAPEAPSTTVGTGVVRGTVESEGPAQVVVKVKRKQGKRWTVARTTTLTTKRNGKFRRQLPDLAVGHYRVAAYSVGQNRGRTVLSRPWFVVR